MESFDYVKFRLVLVHWRNTAECLETAPFILLNHEVSGVEYIHTLRSGKMIYTLFVLLPLRAHFTRNLALLRFPYCYPPLMKPLIGI